MRKRMAFALIFIVFLTFTAWANMVSFYVIETGVPEYIEDVRHSIHWENALLDIFFDAGYIVTNAPLLRLERKPAGDIVRYVDIQEARNTGADYILIAQLDYAGDYSSPGEVSLFIYNVASREKLIERKLTTRSYRTGQNEYEDIKTVVRGLVSYIRK